MTWMVTGGSGFLGRHVLATLMGRVVALGRSRPPAWPPDAFVRADLDDGPATVRAVAAIAPDVVIHAAGRTPPATSHSLYLANVRATMHLLEAIRLAGRPCRVVLAGSAAELGPVPNEHLPTSEDCPCHPTDAYGMSKWAATRLGLIQTPPLSVVVGRIFNPIGPGLPTSQAFGRFAAKLIDPNADVLKVGDLAARRDFVDVRDAAAALVALAERGEAGRVYHIGTGESRSVGEGLHELIHLAGRSMLVESTPIRRGPSQSCADITRIGREVGWVPRIPFARSLADLWSEASRKAGPRLVA